MKRVECPLWVNRFTSAMSSLRPLYPESGHLFGMLAEWRFAIFRSRFPPKDAVIAPARIPSLCLHRTWQVRLKRRDSKISAKQSGTDSPGEMRRPAPRLVKSHTMQSIAAAESAVTILPGFSIWVRFTRRWSCMTNSLVNSIGRLRLCGADFTFPKSIVELRGYRGQICRLSVF